jgi:hypothetical protein
MIGDRDRRDDLLRDDESLSRALRSLPRRVPPSWLVSSLRVIASRERRRMVHGHAVVDRLRLFADNLARPLALPFAGGLFSAFVLFSMWVVPSYPLRASSTYDVPTLMVERGESWWDRRTAAVRDAAPIASNSGDVIVDVIVDGQGRMIDYAIVNGKVTRELEGVLLVMRFTPATTFGRPVLGKVRVSLSRSNSSQIEVRG